MLNILNSPYIKDIHYCNEGELLRAISYGGELYELFDEHCIFRGHSTDQYELIPSALRGNLTLESCSIQTMDTDEKKRMLSYLANTEISQILQEYKLLQDFFIVCDRNGLYVPYIESLRNSFLPGVDGKTVLLEGNWLSKEYWELAALAQHHGVKTRLLDWTYDLNIALYFASTGVYNDPKEELSLTKSWEAYRKGEEYPKKQNIEIWALNMEVVMVKPNQVPLRLVVPQYHNNDNLCAQKGLFTFWEICKPALDNKMDVTLHTDRRSLDVQLHEYLSGLNVPAKEYLYHITVPQKTACSLYSHIEKMGYNASSIFPGYDGVVRYLKEHLMMLKR